MDLTDYADIASELGMSLMGVIAVSWIVCCALFGVLVARWAGSARWLGALLGVLLPIVGPITAGLISYNRRRNAGSLPPPGGRLTPAGLRWASVGALAVAVAAGSAAFAAAWFVVDFGMPGARFPLLTDPGAGLFALGSSALVVAVSIGLVFLHRWINLGAMLVLPVGVAWLATGVAALLFVDHAQAAIDKAGEWATSTADVFALLGIDPHQFDSLEVAGVKMDVATMSLDAIPHIRLELGAAWLFVMTAAGLLTLWAACVAFWPVGEGVALREGRRSAGAPVSAASSSRAVAGVTGVLSAARERLSVRGNGNAPVQETGFSAPDVGNPSGAGNQVANGPLGGPLDPFGNGQSASGPAGADPFAPHGPTGSWPPTQSAGPLQGDDPFSPRPGSGGFGSFGGGHV